MSPARMLSDGPPSREAVTISRTWRDSVDVNTFTSSGMIAPASVPQVMIAESFHHIVVSPLRFGMRRCDARNVTPIQISDVSHTNDVSGCSKLNDVASLYFADANAWLIQYDATEVTIISTRMTKIQTRSCVCTVELTTARRMNVMSATPVTP